MTLGLLIALVLVVAGFLLDRRGERAALALERSRERAAIHEERLNWMRERATLLNRINPMTAQAVPEPIGDDVMPQPAADSEEWWQQFTDRFTEST